MISGTFGEPALEVAQTAACDESVDRRFLSRSVNLVALPVEIRTKYSGDGRGTKSPIQPIGRRSGGRLRSTGLFGCAEAPFPKGTSLVRLVGGRIRGVTEACRCELLFQESVKPVYLSAVRSSARTEHWSLLGG